MTNLTNAEDYFWRVIERDLDAYLERGGSDREVDHLRLAHHYGVPLVSVRKVWIGARDLRLQYRGIAG